MEGEQRNPPFLLEKDRRFLESIRGNMLTETEKVGCAEQGPSEERYIIYRNAFDKLLMSLVEWLGIHLNILKVLSCLEGINPHLYFDTLINTSTASGHLPNLPVTLEAIKCALSEKQLNVVNHQVTRQRVTFSEAAGDVNYDYGKEEPNNMMECLAWAQAAYGHSGAYKKSCIVPL
ncbi:clathrin heavy chain linker domain-containing protein 1 [Oxyura jamaicensis]|uniref:clathrin heavy chain linker domain-containing protein 1 n=1 Tax=Oxyura jamaicensis TaxID=8884 RepID=UPI0015A6FFCB|nr:clathrin heavy chain linker domain-containing protein 1 [Oxyura jamaicensis]